MSSPNPNLNRWANQVALTAAATAATLHTVSSATMYAYVTKLILSITTVANAKKTTLTDSAASPIVYATYMDLTETAANNKAAGTGGVITLDFGRRGVRMTLGKNVTVTGEASGSAGWAIGEGYESAV